MELPYLDTIAPPTLRPYQLDLINKARNALATQQGDRRLIIQAETGSGKSLLASTMICNAVQMGKSALFIARGRLLVTQFAKHLRECNVKAGILMAGHGWTDLPVQIASKDTLASRYLRNQWIGMRSFDLCIVDECHDGGAEWRELIAKFRLVVGMTATPALPNGNSMGLPWKGLVCCAPPSALIQQGYIVPTRVFAPYVPDLKGIRKDSETGDYVIKQLSERMDRPSLIGDVVQNWKKYGDNRPTLVFAVNIDHAKHIRDRFLAEGIPALHIDQETPDDQRQSTFQATIDGKNKVITNVAVMSRGVDLPCISCIVLARPTRSFVLYRQTIGRGKRPWPGKNDLIVIDHAGACYSHGMPDDDIPWGLAEGGNIHEKLQKDRSEGRVPEPMTCPKCFAMFVNRQACPNCGHVMAKRQTRQAKASNGLLVPVTEMNEAAKFEEKQRFWKTCLFVMARKNRNFIAARAMYRSKYKEWPDAGFKPMPAKECWESRIIDVYPGMDPQAMKAKREAKGERNESQSKVRDCAVV